MVATSPLSFKGEGAQATHPSCYRLCSAVPRSNLSANKPLLHRKANSLGHRNWFGGHRKLSTVYEYLSGLAKVPRSGKGHETLSVEYTRLQVQHSSIPMADPFVNAGSAYREAMASLKLKHMLMLD